MSSLEQSRDRFLELWDGFQSDRCGDEPAFLADLRRLARDRFAEVGLPSTRWEEWRYTSLKRLAELRFERPGEPAAIDRQKIEAISFPVFACSLYVFVNGRYVPSLSASGALSGGLRVEGLGALASQEPERLEALLAGCAPRKEHPFTALNAAFLEDGAVVTIPAGDDIEHAVHLVFVSTGSAPTASHPRVVVRAGAGSRATVIQDHVSLGEAAQADEADGTGQTPHLSNAVTDLVLEAGANLEWVLVQRESDSTHAFTNLSARQERDSRLVCHTMTLGGDLVRNDLSVLLADEGAECTLNGLFLGVGEQVIDNHTLVDHAMPHCSSRELYKGILAERSRGVFRGRVLVRPDAQKTDAQQSNPNLLLSDGAEIDTKPQLEIHADDVKCSHGSAIGRIDPDALFYLRARGIGEVAARALLTRGFAREVLGGLPHDALAEALEARLAERLARAGAGG